MPTISILRWSAQRGQLLAATILLGGGTLSSSPVVAQLVVDDNHRIFQSIIQTIEANDRFGASLASGDFDRDGYDDLAIGVPGEAIGTLDDAGAVAVVFGSSAGLGFGSRSPVWLHQSVAGVQNVAEAGDEFGLALTAGDFDGDGFDELVVGVPGEGFEISPGVFILEAGAFHVFLGGPGGIVPAADQFFHGDSFEGVWNDGFGDRLGSSLAAGDLTGNGIFDLFVGVPAADTIPSFDDEGAVLHLLGSPAGLDPENAGAFVPPTREAGDRFGSSVAIGNLDGGPLRDIAFGAPFAEIDPAPTDSGRVWTILNGSNLWLTGGGQNARFGTALASGDFSGLGYEQLLVGAPGNDTEGVDEAGVVFAFDFVSTGVVGLWQGESGILETPEPFDQFGQALATGDFDRDGYDDAVFGIPGENLEPGIENGVVQVVYGSAAGLHSAGNQLWSLDAPINFGSLSGDRFGAAVASGDFDGDGVDDLAIGAPDATWAGQVETGFVQILYGRDHGWLFADGFESGDTLAWE